MTLLLFAVAVAPAVAIGFFVWSKDKYEKEPLKPILISFFLGCLSIVPALILELFFGEIFPENNWNLALTAFHAFLIVGFSEEISKFLMLRYYAWKQKEFNEPYDGIVYGVMISLGFAAFENVMYVVEGGLSVAILRMFTAVPAHAIFGIIMGYYFGHAYIDKANKTQHMLRGLMAAVLLHGAYDFFLFQQNFPALAFVSLIGVAIAGRICLKAMKAHNERSPFKDGILPEEDEIEGIEEGNEEN
ncbi:MAG: PrsW family intramembrane metalloprotease [Chitinophagales bacterium]